MKPRGLTLIELTIALALLAVLATLALPSFGSAVDRTRLKAAAETLAADLGEARFQAAQRGLPLHLGFRIGPDWCWAVATAPDCPCDQTQACRLKTENAAAYPGVTLLEANATRFDPDGQAVAEGAATGALLQSRRGERLRVLVTPLGRALVCTPDASVSGYPRC
jgi:type IV fimbrial biogenesis protein FimT